MRFCLVGHLGEQKDGHLLLLARYNNIKQSKRMRFCLRESPSRIGLMLLLARNNNIKHRGSNSNANEVDEEVLRNAVLQFSNILRYIQR